MKNYVLEIGSSSYFIGHRTESRKLYRTYEEAKAEYDRILKESYDEEELAVDEDGYNELRDECEGVVNPEAGYIDSWADDENDVYLYIYAVDVVGAEEESKHSMITDEAAEAVKDAAKHASDEDMKTWKEKERLIYLINKDKACGLDRDELLEVTNLITKYGRPA